MFRQRPRTNQGGSEVGASPDVGLDLFFVSVLGVLSVKFEFAGVWKARF